MAVLYRAFDLRVSSEVAIPGAQVLDLSLLDQALPPDLTIATGSASLRGEQRRWGPYTISPDGLIFDQPFFARYACSATGLHITVEAAQGADDADFSTSLIATALPAALWMRGDLVLHASAAVLPGTRRSLAFAGVSGSGKSCILRALLDHGANIVAEDSLCLRARDAAMQASGLPASLFLRQAGDALDADREVFAVPRSQQNSAADLGAIVVLENSATGFHEVPRRLSTGRALEALLRHRHRANVPHLLGLDAALLPRFAVLAQAVPVYLWNRPCDGPALDLAEFQVLCSLIGEDH